MLWGFQPSEIAKLAVILYLGMVFIGANVARSGSDERLAAHVCCLRLRRSVLIAGLVLDATRSWHSRRDFLDRAGDVIRLWGFAEVGSGPCRGGAAR